VFSGILAVGERDWKTGGRRTLGDSLTSIITAFVANSRDSARPYEVTAQIGVGGMGEVYRATDTILGRQVAIKVLPEVFAQDAERVARFEREAKTLASLITRTSRLSTAWSLGVMEPVEGEDLSINGLIVAIVSD
jgi:serine/threonine protein kinase